MSIVVGSAVALPPGNWKLQWRDEFDGKVLNASWWNVGTLAAKNGDLIPGSYKSEHLLNWKYAGYIMEDDVLLDNGMLSLRNQKREIKGTNPVGDFHYSSGLIHTLHNIFYTYGYIEAKIRMPLGSKVWPAFWTIQESLQWGAEFDIGEYFGTGFHKACTQTEGTNIQGEVEKLQKICSLSDCCKHAGLAAGKTAVHFRNGSCAMMSSGKGASFSDPDALLIQSSWADSHAGLHTGIGGQQWYEQWYPICLDVKDPAMCQAHSWNTYGLRWGPDGFEMYLNGRIVNSATASAVNDYPTENMYVVLNNGVASQPPDDDTPWPNTADFDYVRLYKEVGPDGELIGGPVHFGADAIELMV